jgi:hypothetical protein
MKDDFVEHLHPPRIDGDRSDPHNHAIARRKMAPKEGKTREYMLSTERSRHVQQAGASTAHKNSSHASLSHHHHHPTNNHPPSPRSRTLVTQRPLDGHPSTTNSPFPLPTQPLPPAQPAPTIFLQTQKNIASQRCHVVSSPAASGPGLKSAATSRGRCTSKTARSTSVAARVTATSRSSSAVAPRTPHL